MTLAEFIQVFSDSEKLNTDMCVIRYEGADYVSSDFKAYTMLSEIPISMDSNVCHAYYEDGCLFVEVAD